MAQALSGGVDGLRAGVRGAVHCPGDPEYDQVRKVWNSQIDRRPAVVVMCESPADVSAALCYARAEGLAVSVRGGAHNTSGSAVNDGGLMINLSRMNGVEVDPGMRRVRVGGGALLSDMDAATQAYGLATPGGMISHTGVAGLALGGGQGWLSRRFGMAIDNLVGAEVVLADGSVVWADEDAHPDLFWALRGGGGNFGVVTTFEFALHEVDPMVQVAFLFWEVERGAEALRVIRDVAVDLPLEFNLVIGGFNAPPAPFVPEEHLFKPGFALILVGFGDPASHAAKVDEVRAALPPLFDAVLPMPYTVLQTMQDEGTAWGQLAYEKGTQLPSLSDEVVDILVQHLPKRRSPLSQVLFYWLDGAYSQVAEDATAYGGTRTPRFAAMIVGLAHDMDSWASDREWVRNLWSALQPYSLGIGDYVNNMVEFEEDRILASYGAAKYGRLSRIKGVYDPDNVFRCNVNIPPAGAG